MRLVCSMARLKHQQQQKKNENPHGYKNFRIWKFLHMWIIKLEKLGLWTELFVTNNPQSNMKIFFKQTCNVVMQVWSSGRLEHPLPLWRQPGVLLIHVQGSLACLVVVVVVAALHRHIVLNVNAVFIAVMLLGWGIVVGCCRACHKGSSKLRKCY